MPRYGAKKKLVEEEISSQVDELCQNNPVPIFTLAIGRTVSTARVITAPVIQEKPQPVTIITRTQAQNKRTQPGLFQAENTQDRAEIHDKRRRILEPKMDYPDLKIYGDLSTAARAHQTVLQSLAEEYNLSEESVRPK